ncbi:hypothetical protein VCCP1040_3769, partial [Vibrio cholerae CP1040(13)]
MYCDILNDTDGISSAIFRNRNVSPERAYQKFRLT